MGQSNKEWNCGFFGCILTDNVHRKGKKFLYPNPSICSKANSCHVSYLISFLNFKGYRRNSSMCKEIMVIIERVCEYRHQE